MMSHIILISALILSFFATSAFADKCKDPIVDEVGVLSSDDTAQISKAMNKLVSQGADPRVHILSSYHNSSSIDGHQVAFQKICAAKGWQENDGKLKSNMILIFFVPKKGAVGLYYGNQWKERLDSVKSSVLSSLSGSSSIASGISYGLTSLGGTLSGKSLPSQNIAPSHLSVISAQVCNESLLDEEKVLSSSETSQILAAMNKLTLRGADPRVHILSSLHGTGSIEAYKKSMQSSCASWRSADGGFKNNMILILFAPAEKVLSFSYGEQWRRFLESGKASVFTDMAARFREKKIAEGIVAGLADVDNLLSVRLSEANKSVVINNPTDYSGFWSVLKGIVVVGVIVFILWIGYLLFRRKEQRRSVQRDAITMKGSCVKEVHRYETPIALLKSQIAKTRLVGAQKENLDAVILKVESLYRVALAQFENLEQSRNNPEAPNLSDLEYANIKERYEKLLDEFRKVDTMLETVERMLAAPQNVPYVSTEVPVEKNATATPDNGKAVSPPAAAARREKTYLRRSAPVQPQASRDTHEHHQSGDTIIAPIILGGGGSDNESSWERHRERDPDVPVIVDPRDDMQSPSSDGDSISGNIGNSGDGDTHSGSIGISNPDGDGVSGSIMQDDNASSTSTWEGGGGTQY